MGQSSERDAQSSRTSRPGWSRRWRATWIRTHFATWGASPRHAAAAVGHALRCDSKRKSMVYPFHFEETDMSSKKIGFLATTLLMGAMALPVMGQAAPD